LDFIIFEIGDENVFYYSSFELGLGYSSFLRVFFFFFFAFGELSIGANDDENIEFVSSIIVFDETYFTGTSKLTVTTFFIAGDEASIPV
jgi:hypothetical protein